MGIMQNGLWGTARKKIGNIVTYVMGGQQIARTMPASYNDKNSDAQKTTRQRLMVLTTVARTLLFLFALGFQERDRKRSGYNEFMSINNPTALNGNYPAVSITWSDLQISKGSLRGALEATATAAAGHTVSFDWVDNTNNTTAFEDDIVVLVCYNSTLDEVATNVIAAERQDIGEDVVVPASWVGDAVYCYIYFYNETLSKSSDSFYAGLKTILA